MGGTGMYVRLAVSKLAAEAIVGMPVEREGSVPKCLVLTLKVEESGPVAPPSRYKNEFEELGCLGRGGFGVVYRARNRLDGQEYAVKKVKLNCRPDDFALFMSAETTSTMTTTMTHHARTPSSGSSLMPVSPSPQQLSRFATNLHNPPYTRFPLSRGSPCPHGDCLKQIQGC
ncbi:hypothetical protein BC829DRAFT_52068 [Chytridium lagenaria]|nr:hypothetical protein BC829DRAFT_52068 [Chytridium lagenaria]